MPKRSYHSAKRGLWILTLALIGAVLLLLAAKWVLFPVQSPSVELSAEVSARTLLVQKRFSGKLTPVSDQTQYAKYTFKVWAFKVAEGETVQAGQPLLTDESGVDVLAEYAGKVVSFHVQEKQQLTAGSAIARIVDYDHLKVQMDADEYDVPLLKTGQSVSASFPATGAKADGVISSIAQEAKTEDEISYYKQGICA